MLLNHHTARCDWKSSLLVVVFALLQSFTFLRAQSVMVNVTPVQPILPPQVLLYVSDPGKFFNIQLSNNSGTPVPVHLQLEIEHVNPALGLKVITPASVQPAKPFLVPGNGTYQLNVVEMNSLFDHIPSDMIQAPQGLFDDVSNGSFGLLPEGQYRARVVAYKWANPQYEVPVVASNPASGTCLFTVCYKAQAPEFIPKEPVANARGNRVFKSGEIIQFNWTIPTINCGASATYNYDFRVVELLPGQEPDYAMDHNPTVYRVQKLIAPTCIIPFDVANRLFSPDKNYLCQVTANPNTNSALNYVMLNNGGLSDIRMFHIEETAPPSPFDDEKDDTAAPPSPFDDDDDDTAAPPSPFDDDDDDTAAPPSPFDDADDYDGEFIWLGSEVTDSLSTDALYNFRNPTLTLPAFGEFGARRKYLGDDINVAWNSVFFLGGEGENPEDLKFEYVVSLYKGVDKEANREETLKTEPILTKTVTDDEELTTTFSWAELEDKVDDRDYLVLQVVPRCTNADSIAYHNDEANITDFAVVKHLYESFFECSNRLTVENTTPTTKSLDELRGSTVTIGEYELTLDSRALTLNPDGTYQGRGKIKWEPLGTTVGLCVKFDTLRINTDDIVYSGLCYTYAQNNTISDAEVVEKLFSDWGIDTFIGDSGLPYADRLGSEARDKAKNLAAQVDLAKYYKYITTGEATAHFLGTADIDELYLPCDLPEAINSSPVKIQISTMKFAPTHATMDLIGEFTLPNTNYLKNDILVFGAPRLCISPTDVIPEAGTIALLKDFVIADPKSSYTMNFKAPADVITPADGCYIAWKDHKFEVLGVDIDMEIPHLRKDKDGEALSESPVLNVRATIADWDNWLVDGITMDPFQVEDLPGWTFEATNIIYDHSLFRNSQTMGPFPAAYDKRLAGITSTVESGGEHYTVEGDASWQGLYVEKVDVLFPKSFEMSDASEGRFRATVTNMFFDKSGATMSSGFKDIFSVTDVRKGKVGGWSFSIDDVRLSFVQSNFDNCHFGGKIGVPLLKKSSNEDEYAKLGYDCQIRKALRDGKEIDNTAYIFTIQQMDDEMTLDFLIAKAKFDKKLTYFAVEAESGDVDYKTHVELMMGGNMTIGGTEWLESKLKINLPDIHFSGLRIANCDPSWRSEYSHLKTMQNNANDDKTKLLLKLYEGTTFNNSDNTFYFSTGAWSLASLEKSIGPFSFTLDKYSIEQDKDPLPDNKKGGDMNLKLAIGGKVGLVKGIEISASAYVSLRFSINGLTDLGNIGASFNGCTLDSLGVHTAFCGITIDGKMAQEDSEARTGFTGTLGVKMPGGIFDMDMTGGYYEEKAKGTTSAFTWGYFTLSLGGKSGIPIPPVQLNKITGGFYFNCKPGKGTASPTPKEGEIGIIMGMGIATMGSDGVLSGDFTMTVIYDKKRNNGAGGLTQFLFLGEVNAVDGLIKANIKLLYESNDTDEYFQLTLTADSSLDNFEGVKAFNSQMESLSKSLTPNAEAGLKNLEEEQNKNAKNKTGETDKPTPKGDGSTKVASVQISLDIKITKRANGKDLDKVKWHVYLGEPDFEKRCSLTLIDFKSPVVSVRVGANAYVCVGNELPGDGQLPPIPTKISQFLTGSQSGVVKSDGVDQANSARAQAMKNFGGSIAGGVMFGAEVYGSLNVDLGILKAGIEADAGFDISLRKLQGAVCTNTNGRPGWHDWYGEGQLYAYLKAYIDLCIRLGFYNKDLPIADAAIGGVLHMGGPNPTYFDGKLRAKVNLLGGLVSFDKKFEFECGEKCDLFMGNALDNFVLFDYCTLGDTVMSRGWNEANAISPYVRQAPYINTNANVDQHFRVLDPTELNKISEGYKGDVEDLKIEAERTFIFHRDDVALLFEYDNARQYSHQIWKKHRRRGFDHMDRTAYGNINIVNAQYPLNRNHNNYTNCYEIKLNSSNPRHHMIDMAELRRHLKPNMYYRLEFNGRAKEVEHGKEVDPVTFDTDASKYIHKAWEESYDIFFCTSSETAFDDKCDLQDFIVLAYPSYANKLYDGVKDSDVQYYKPVYLHDAKAPTIALSKDISKTAYSKGKLYWRWLDKMGREIHREENAWVVADNMCNMEPQRPCNVLTRNGYYILSLDYVTFGKEGDNVKTDTLNLGRLHINTIDNDWREGYASENLSYERPFKAVRLVDYQYADYSGQVTNKTDIGLGYVTEKINGKLARYKNPFLFIPYLSDFAFIGGWDVNTSYYDMHITTSQSVLMRMQGAGVYEGSFGARTGTKIPMYDNQSANIWADQEVVRDMFLYDEKQYRPVYGLWPLPKSKNTQDENVLNYDERTYPFTPSSTKLGYIAASRGDIMNRYKWVYDFDTSIRTEVDNFLTFLKGKSGDAKKKAVREWIAGHRGTYLCAGSSEYNNKSKTEYAKSEQADKYFLSLPFYQIPFTMGTEFQEPIYYVFQDIMHKQHYRAYGDVMAYTARNFLKPIADNAFHDTHYFYDDAQFYYKRAGLDTMPSTTNENYSYQQAAEEINSANFYVYRVNAYNFATGQYCVRRDLLNGSGATLMTVKFPFTEHASVESAETMGSSGGGSVGLSGGSVGLSDDGSMGLSDQLVSIKAQLTEFSSVAHDRHAWLVRNKSLPRLLEQAQATTSSFAKAVSGRLSGLSDDGSVGLSDDGFKGLFDKMVDFHEQLESAYNDIGRQVPNVEAYMTQASKTIGTLRTALATNSVDRINAESDYKACQTFGDAHAEDYAAIVALYAKGDSAFRAVKGLVDGLYGPDAEDVIRDYNHEQAELLRIVPTFHEDYKMYETRVRKERAAVSANERHLDALGYGAKMYAETGDDRYRRSYSTMGYEGHYDAIVNAIATAEKTYREETAPLVDKLDPCRERIDYLYARLTGLGWTPQKQSLFPRQYEQYCEDVKGYDVSRRELKSLHETLEAQCRAADDTLSKYLNVMSDEDIRDTFRSLQGSYDHMVEIVARMRSRNEQMLQRSHKTPEEFKAMTDYVDAVVRDYNGILHKDSRYFEQNYVFPGYEQAVEYCTLINTFGNLVDECAADMADYDVERSVFLDLQNALLANRHLPNDVKRNIPAPPTPSTILPLYDLYTKHADVCREQATRLPATHESLYTFVVNLNDEFWLPFKKSDAVQEKFDALYPNIGVAEKKMKEYADRIGRGTLDAKAASTRRLMDDLIDQTEADYGQLAQLAQEGTTPDDYTLYPMYNPIVPAANFYLTHPANDQKRARIEGIQAALPEKLYSFSGGYADRAERNVSDVESAQVTLDIMKATRDELLAVDYTAIADLNEQIAATESKLRAMEPTFRPFFDEVVRYDKYMQSQGLSLRYEPKDWFYGRSYDTPEDVEKFCTLAMETLDYRKNFVKRLDVAQWTEYYTLRSAIADLYGRLLRSMPRATDVYDETESRSRAFSRLTESAETLQVDFIDFVNDEAKFRSDIEKFRKETQERLSRR